VAASPFFGCCRLWNFSTCWMTTTRQLMVPSPCGKARALLVRNAMCRVLWPTARTSFRHRPVTMCCVSTSLAVAPCSNLGFGWLSHGRRGRHRAQWLPPRRRSAGHCRWPAQICAACAEVFLDQLDLP